MSATCLSDSGRVAQVSDPGAERTRPGAGPCWAVGTDGGQSACPGSGRACGGWSAWTALFRYLVERRQSPGQRLETVPGRHSVPGTRPGPELVSANTQNREGDVEGILSGAPVCVEWKAPPTRPGLPVSRVELGRRAPRPRPQQLLFDSRWTWLLTSTRTPTLAHRALCAGVPTGVWAPGPRPWAAPCAVTLKLLLRPRARPVHLEKGRPRARSSSVPGRAGWSPSTPHTRSAGEQPSPPADFLRPGDRPPNGFPAEAALGTRRGLNHTPV